MCEKTKNELHTKQKELAVKNSKLADVDMEVKLLQLKKNIIQSQKDNLLESNCKISKEFVRKSKLIYFLSYSYFI